MEMGVYLCKYKSLQLAIAICKEILIQKRTKNKWITHDEWQKAIDARDNGTITKKQQEILDNGHWNHE